MIPQMPLINAEHPSHLHFGADQSPPTRDAAQRKNIWLWRSGGAFAGFMLLGVAAWGVLPARVAYGHSSGLAFSPGLPALRPAGLDTAVPRGMNRRPLLTTGPVMFAGSKDKLRSKAIAMQTTATDTQSTGTATIEDVEFPCPTVAIAPPKIQWTVPAGAPGLKLAWKDEDGAWFDDDGPRDGPPRNYWRQSMDEKAFRRDMDVVEAVLGTGTVVEEHIKELERSCTMRNPTLSRKVLGTWAPIVVNNRVVAVQQDKAPWKEPILALCTVDVFRTAGRKMGVKNNYGQFDAHFEEGEELTLNTMGDGWTITSKVLAGEDNSVIQMASMDALPIFDGGRLTFGGVTYLSGYMMIMRDADGAVEIWLRS